MASSNHALRQALVAATVFSAGCSGGVGRVHPPAYSANAGRDALIAYDANRDGAIAGAELDRVPALRASLHQVDANGDGRLTAEEIDARVQAWKASRIAEMPVRCMVTLDGVPLADARVDFIPEAFLGAELSPASGTTSASGSAGITLPKERLADPRYAGVACGWYKILVTSSCREIPARYNTETTLGCEVAMNANWVNDGEVKLVLKSQ